MRINQQSFLAAKPFSAKAIPAKATPAKATPARALRRGSLALEAALVIPPLLIIIAFFLAGIIHEQRRLAMIAALDAVAAELSWVEPFRSVANFSGERLMDWLPAAATLSDWQSAEIPKISEWLDEALQDKLIRYRLRYWLEQSGQKFNRDWWAQIEPTLTLEQMKDPVRPVIWLNATYQSPILNITVETSVRSAIPLWTLPDLALSDTKTSSDAVWMLDNLSRGPAIREAMGSNLPYDFPVIARWFDGQAILIHSIDLTAPTYQDRSEITAAVNDKITRLADFSQASYAREGETITLVKNQIQSRQLWLVVPQNYDPTVCEPALIALREQATALGVTLIVRTYGVSYRYLESSPQNPAS